MLKLLNAFTVQIFKKYLVVNVSGPQMLFALKL